MTAIHVVRPGSTKSNGRSRKGTASPEYPPGYFTEPCRAWWPGWVPLMDYGRASAEDRREQHSKEQGAAIRAQGKGFGINGGTINLPGTSKAPPPGWMQPKLINPSGGGRG